MSYKSNVTCPVCGDVMDEVTHPEKEPSGFGVAMVSGDCRREHLKTSPSCADHADWILGWKIVPQE